MLSGLKFIPRDQIDDKTHDENINDSDTRKSYKKKKKSHHSNSSDDDTQRIKKKSKKKWYSSEEDSSSYSDASESNSDQDTRRHKKKKKEKKHKGKSEPKEKGKSKKSKRKEYSSDDDDCPKEDNKSKDNIVRKEMGLEWMLKPKDDLDKKPASTSDLLEETPTKEIKKSNPRELNPYFKNDGTGYPEEENEEGAKSGDTNLLSTSVVGDGGASWRLKALKRAQEQAAREGKNLDEVVGERWGSLGKLAVSVASHSAAPSRAHLHAIKNRQRLQNKDQKTPPQNQTENERDSEKRTPSQHGGMRVPKSDGSLSWGKKKSQSQSQSQKEDAGVISSALSSLQKFSNDGSFLNQFKSQKNEDLSSSSSSNVSKSEEPSLKKEDTNTIVKPALSANQLAAKVVQLRMKGKHEEADKLLKETEVYEEKSQAGIITNNPQGDGSASRYIMHGIKARKEKKEEDADMHVARSIMQNKQYTNVSNQADDEYEYDDGMGPKRKKKNKESQKSMGNNNTRFEKRILTQQERCNFCFENPKRPRHLVVAIANFTYLMLPQFQPLVPGHCYILPMQHELATRSVDDNVWDEIRNFKKCLLMMFAKQEKDVIFLETVIGLSKQTRHCLIECIPLPPDVAKQGPLYFKKAIDEAEDEWSQHNAKKLIDTSEKGLRHSIPKDFPYFHVEFGLKKGFVHVIDDESQFKASFGINVVRGMLRLPAEDMHRHRQKHDSVDTQKEAVGNFVRDWADFDWTKQLDS